MSSGGRLPLGFATLKRVPASFYRSSRGSEPVRDWLKSLSAKDRKVIGTDIATIEYGWPVGMPVCRSLDKGLWEVRSNIKDGISRVIFCFHDNHLVLLNGFIKKGQKTPVEEIELALRRKKELER